MKVCCLVPARAGSKGIPGKNRIVIGGKPLIDWTINHATSSKYVTDTCILSDDPEIREIAEQRGVLAIDRPENISGDNSASEEVLEYGLDQLESIRSTRYDLVVFLQATSPLRSTDDIDKAIDTFLGENADSLFSAYRLVGPCIWEKSGESLKSISYDYRNRRMRQKWDTQLLENGSIYIFKPEILRKDKNRLGGKIAYYEMDFWKSFQIDEPEDIELVEFFINKNLIQHD